MKEKERYIHRERNYITFCRYLKLPETVNPDKAEATLKDGILNIKIPKMKPTDERRVILIK